MFFMVVLLKCLALTIPRKSPFISVTPALSMATSVPVPMGLCEGRVIDAVLATPVVLWALFVRAWQSLDHAYGGGSSRGPKGLKGHAAGQLPSGVANDLGMHGTGPFDFLIPMGMRFFVDRAAAAGRTAGSGVSLFVPILDAFTGV
jgi:hypothetical protein